MTKSDGLVKRLRDRGVCSLAHNSCRNDIACEQAADRIEELEAKLTKAVVALEGFIRLDEDYSPFGGELMEDRVERTWTNARATLEELKGESNGG